MKARSPIEMMIDKACGFDPSIVEEKTAPADDTEAQGEALMWVGTTAADWVKEKNIERKEKKRLLLIDRVNKLIELGW